MKLLVLCLALSCGSFISADATNDLLNAAKKNDLQGVRAALNAGADPNAGAKVKYGVLQKVEPPLITAAYAGNKDMVQVLIDAKANPNITIQMGPYFVTAYDMAKTDEIRALLKNDGGKTAEDMSKSK